MSIYRGLVNRKLLIHSKLAGEFLIEEDGMKMNKYVCMIAYSNYQFDNRVRREAETLAALENYRVTVLTPKTEQDPKTYQLSGVEIRELNIAKYQGKDNCSYMLSYLKFTILAFLACNRLLIRKTLDVIHIHNMPNFIIFAASIPALFGKKVVLDIHDTMIETYTAKYQNVSNKLRFKLLILILRMEEFLCCSFAHKIICVNQIQKDALVRRGIPAQKITISINVPDPKMFTLQKKDVVQQNSNNSFRLIYHGTLAKRLGIDMTIRAVALLKTSIPDLEFHIIGNGDDKQEFIGLSKELSVHDHVKFWNPVPLHDIASIIEKMDLGVISNRDNIASELMLPVKMLEYVSLGIPVVVPRLKTIEHYFTDGMVFFYEPDNIQSLAQIIQHAYQNKATRKEKAERAKKFIDQYGWSTHKNDFIALYEKLFN